MTTQKDNAMDAMQDFFPNGGREWDAIGALYDAIAAGKIPGVVTGEKVAELEQRLQQPIPALGSVEVNDAAWKLHNMLIEHGPLNGHQFNNLKGCFYEALKTCFKVEGE